MRSAGSLRVLSNQSRRHPIRQRVRHDRRDNSIVLLTSPARPAGLRLGLRLFARNSGFWRRSAHAATTSAAAYAIRVRNPPLRIEVLHLAEAHRATQTHRRYAEG